MAELHTDTDGLDVTLDLPVRDSELTLRLRGVQARGVTVQHAPLQEVRARRDFAGGTFYQEGADTLVAFAPGERTVHVRVHP
jgi:hypothetical protein